MSETRKVNFLTRLGDDYRASREYLDSRKKLAALAAQRESAVKELESACHELGAKAAEVGAAAELPAAQGAAEKKQNLAVAQAALSEREAALRTAEDALAAETEKHGAIIRGLQDEHRSLLEATRSAKSEVDQIWQQVKEHETQIHAHESAIASAAEGAPTAEPVDALHQKISESAQAKRAAEAQLPAAQERHAKTASVAAGKASEVSTAQGAWREVEARCKADVQSAGAARDEAQKAVQSASAEMRAAESALGHAIFESTARPAELEANLASTQSAAARLADLEQQRTALEKRVAETKSPASRFALIVAITALVIVAIIVIVLVLVLGGGKKNKGAPTTAPSTTMPTTAPTTAPGIR